MKRILIIVASIAALSVASSCTLMDSLFYNAEEVKVSQLDGFSGNPASNEAEAKAAVTAGISSGAVPIGAFSVSGPSGDIIARAFPRLSAASAQSADRSSSPRSLPPGGQPKADGSVDYSWSGNDYAISSNPRTTISGSLKYSISANAVAKTTENTLAVKMDVDASIEGDLQAKVEPYAPSGINGGFMNLKAKGNASLVGALATGYQTSGYAALSMNAGFSLDNTSTATGGHAGGKYIVSVKYVENYKVALNLTDIAGSAAAKVKMDVTVKVYGNDDKFIKEYQFTAADFADAAF